jgi:flagellar biosynthetic protein FliO
MSHGWIILLTLVAQVETAPASATGLSEPATIYTSPQLQPLPAAGPTAANADVQLTTAMEGREAQGEGRVMLDGNKPLPLAPRGSGADGAASIKRSAPTPGGSITTVVSSLAIVLGLLFGVMWLMKRTGPAGSQPLPSDVLQVLGRAMLSPRQQMQLVRIGDRLVLIANTPTGVQTLTEITDRAEVERLAAACEAARGSSSTATFRQVLTQLGSEPTASGFFGRDDAAGQRARPQQQTRRNGAEVRHA